MGKSAGGGFLMKVICAFSSDSRPLYIADIYRVLALPEDYIVRFRYKKKYVGDAILNDPQSVIGADVAVFFSGGNKAVSTPSNDLTHVSVRMAQIVKVEVSESTNVFHVSLSLKRFCDLSLVNVEQGKFFIEADCKINTVDVRWADRVEAVKPFFPRILFFHIKGIYSKCGKKLLLKRGGQSTCFYSLNHGEDYYIDLALGTHESPDLHVGLGINGGDELLVNCINPLQTSAEYDDEPVYISAKSLQLYRQTGLIRFTPIYTSSASKNPELAEYAVNVALDLKLSKCRSLLFASYSTCAALSILGVTTDFGLSAMAGYAVKSMSALFFLGSAFVLYSYFDKK